jgi:hypothetical protein
MEKKPEMLDMTTEILPIVLALIDAEKPVWGTFEHTSLVARVSILALDKSTIELGMNSDDSRIFLCKSLDQHGIAGNASQFRQWLVAKKHLPETSAKKSFYK